MSSQEMFTPEEIEARRVRDRAALLEQLEEEDQFGLSQEQQEEEEAAERERIEAEKKAKQEQKSLERLEKIEQKDKEEESVYEYMQRLFEITEDEIDNDAINSQHIEDATITDVNVSNIVKGLLSDVIPAEFIHRIIDYRVPMLIFNLKQVLGYTIEKIKTTVFKQINKLDYKDPEGFKKLHKFDVTFFFEDALEQINTYCANFTDLSSQLTQINESVEQMMWIYFQIFLEKEGEDYTTYELKRKAKKLTPAVINDLQQQIDTKYSELEPGMSQGESMLPGVQTNIETLLSFFDVTIDKTTKTVVTGEVEIPIVPRAFNVYKFYLAFLNYLSEIIKEPIDYNNLLNSLIFFFTEKKSNFLMPDKKRLQLVKILKEKGVTEYFYLEKKFQSMCQNVRNNSLIDIIRSSSSASSNASSSSAAAAAGSDESNYTVNNLISEIQVKIADITYYSQLFSRDTGNTIFAISPYNITIKEQFYNIKDTIDFFVSNFYFLLPQITQSIFLQKIPNLYDIIDIVYSSTLTQQSYPFLPIGITNAVLLIDKKSLKKYSILYYVLSKCDVQLKTSFKTDRNLQVCVQNSYYLLTDDENNVKRFFDESPKSEEILNYFFKQVDIIFSQYKPIIESIKTKFASDLIKFGNPILTNGEPYNPTYNESMSYYTYYDITVIGSPSEPDRKVTLIDLLTLFMSILNNSGIIIIGWGGAWLSKIIAAFNLLTNNNQQLLAELPKDYDWKFFTMPGGEFEQLGLSEDDRAFFFSFVLVIFRYLITLLTQLNTGKTQLYTDEQNIELILGSLKIIIENLGYDEVSRQHGMPFPVNLNAWTTIKNMIIKIIGPDFSLDFKSKLKLDPFDVVYFDYEYFAYKYLHYFGIDILQFPEYFYILFDKIQIEGTGQQYYYILNTRGFIVDITTVILDPVQFINRQPKISKDIFRYFECLIVYLTVYLTYTGSDDLTNNSNPKILLINKILTFLQTYYTQNFNDYNARKVFKTPADFNNTDLIYVLFKRNYNDPDFSTLRDSMKDICLQIFAFETGIPITPNVTQLSEEQNADGFIIPKIIQTTGITDGTDLNRQFLRLPPPFQFKIPNLIINPNLRPINDICIPIIRTLLQTYPLICRIKNDDEREDKSEIKVFLNQIYSPFINSELLTESNKIPLRNTNSGIIESIYDSLISKKTKKNIAHFIEKPEEIDLIEGGSNFTFKIIKTKKNKKNSKKFIKTRKNKKNIKKFIKTRKNKKYKKNIRKSRK
jgi:hypothetical protein